MEPKEARRSEKRGRRKVVVGVVTGDKMQKTIVVEVERFVRHSYLDKYLKRYTVCKAHDEKNEAKTGDKVELMETRPLSKSKRWRLVRIVEKARLGASEQVPGVEQPAVQPPASAAKVGAQKEP